MYLSPEKEQTGSWKKSLPEKVSEIDYFLVWFLKLAKIISRCFVDWSTEHQRSVSEGLWEVSACCCFLGNQWGLQEASLGSGGPVNYCFCNCDYIKSV